MCDPTVVQKLDLTKKLEPSVCDEYGVKKQIVSDIHKGKHKLCDAANLVAKSEQN